jgi:hypothetical protein
MRNSGIAGNWFRNVQHRGIGCILIIFRNSVYHFQYNSGIPGISSYQFLGIPGIPSDSGIEWSSCYPHPHTLAIASNSWTEFRELSQAGIRRNWTEFRPIPELSDHHVTLTLTPWLLYPIPERNSCNWVKQELDGIPGIPSDSGIEWSSCHPHPHTLAIASNSWTEFRELSRAGIGRNSVQLLPIPESDGIRVRSNSGIPGIGRIDSGIPGIDS